MLCNIWWTVKDGSWMNFRKSSKRPLTPLPSFSENCIAYFFPKKPWLKSKICNIIFWIENDPHPTLWNFSINSSVLVPWPSLSLFVISKEIQDFNCGIQLRSLGMFGGLRGRHNVCFEQESHSAMKTSTEFYEAKRYQRHSCIFYLSCFVRTVSPVAYRNRKIFRSVSS